MRNIQLLYILLLIPSILAGGRYEDDAQKVDRQNATIAHLLGNNSSAYDSYTKQPKLREDTYESGIVRYYLSNARQICNYYESTSANFMCNICGLTRKARGTILDHINEAHLQAYTYMCPCGKKSYRITAIQSHMKSKYCPMRCTTSHRRKATKNTHDEAEPHYTPKTPKLFPEEAYDKDSQEIDYPES